MTKNGMLIIAICALSAIITGCATSVVSDENIPEMPENSTKTLKINLLSNTYSRAGEDDEEKNVNTLHIAFLKSGVTPAFVSIHKAEKQSNGSWTVSLPVSVSQPDFDLAVAYANLSENDVNAITTNFLNATSSALVEKESLIMSTAVKFNETSGVEQFTRVTSNHISGQDALEINLDRVASKITVKKDANVSLYTPEAANQDGDKTQLSLSIESWGVTATDHSSHLLRKVPSDNATTLADWAWGSGSYHWSESVGHNAPDPLQIKVNEATFGMGGSAYAHETTRSADNSDATDSKPSIVIVGKYKYEDGTEIGTFFRLRSGGSDIMLTEEEYWKQLADKQNVIFTDASKTGKPDASDLKSILSLGFYEESGKIHTHVVIPSIKHAAPGYYYADGKPATEEYLDNINTELAKTINPMEMYYNGKCIFIEPVTHFRKDSQGNATADFRNALIRNHHYILNIKSIKGFGHGVSSDDMVVTDLTSPTFPDTYTINVTITVNDWIENEQEITIDKNGK